VFDESQTFTIDYRTTKMTQEIHVLEDQYRTAHNAWLESVRVLSEIRPQYMAAKEVHDRIHGMHSSLQEHGYQTQAETLEPMLLNFKDALARFAEPYHQADVECQLADKAVGECKSRLDDAKRAAG
jgi:hypothetical protein